MELTELKCGADCPCRGGDIVGCGRGEIRGVLHMEGHNPRIAFAGTVYIGRGPASPVTTVLVTISDGKSTGTMRSGGLSEASQLLIDMFDRVTVGPVPDVLNGNATGSRRAPVSMNLIRFSRFSSDKVDSTFRLRLTSLDRGSDPYLCRDFIQAKDGQWWSCLIDPPASGGGSAQQLVDDSVVWLHPASRTTVIADLLMILNEEEVDTDGC